MRITTQMMQASAKRAGISLGGTSLLNYINRGSTQTTQGALLNTLNTKQHSAVSKTQSADKEKLKNADVDVIRKVLDGNGTFTSKMAFIASRISDNAKANMESYSSQYGADGYSYVANSSRYDFWG